MVKIGQRQNNIKITKKNFLEIEVYKIFNNNEFEAGQTTVYIFCTISHISYTIGAFHSDKVKKILDKIKFKRK